MNQQDWNSGRFSVLAHMQIDSARSLDGLNLHLVPPGLNARRTVHEKRASAHSLPVPTASRASGQTLKVVSLKIRPLAVKGLASKERTMAAEVQWHFSGDYFENCNCSVVCPCLV